jgi:hypothetical protein
MRKQLIGTAVGALILFVWQFLSWSALQVHKAEFTYTPNQDKIMEALNQNLTEEGTYMMPGVPPGSSYEQEAAAMESGRGKPWASVTYHKSLNTDMGMNMFRGFVVDLLAAFLLVWLLLKFETLNLKTAVQTSVAVGVIGYLTIPYLNSIWFEGNSIGHLIDALVPWSLVGAWLGWWLPRR